MRKQKLRGSGIEGKCGHPQNFNIQTHADGGGNGRPSLTALTTLDAQVQHAVYISVLADILLQYFHWLGWSHMIILI